MRSARASLTYPIAAFKTTTAEIAAASSKAPVMTEINVAPASTATGKLLNWAARMCAELRTWGGVKTFRPVWARRSRAARCVRPVWTDVINPCATACTLIVCQAAPPGPAPPGVSAPLRSARATRSNVGQEMASGSKRMTTLPVSVLGRTFFTPLISPMPTNSKSESSGEFFRPAIPSRRRPGLSWRTHTGSPGPPTSGPALRVWWSIGWLNSAGSDLLSRQRPTGAALVSLASGRPGAAPRLRHVLRRYRRDAVRAPSPPAPPQRYPRPAH